jgi:hypothetical protein
MNGKDQLVRVGDGFPTAKPLFKLVSIGTKGVRIGVLDGSFESGDPTLMLPKKQVVMLANKADGSDYSLKLLRLKVAPPPKAAAPKPPTTATTAASTTTTPAPTTTTTAPTTTTRAPTTTTPVPGAAQPGAVQPGPPVAVAG